MIPQKLQDRLFLHTVSPMQGGAEELERLSGIPSKHIWIDKFMPVDRGFTESDTLPSPGQPGAIRLRAQTPLEEDFLSGSGPVSNPVILAPTDEVILVMLGSQPTVEAVLEYAAESLKLPRVSGGKRYVFLACGRPTSAVYQQLYKETVTLARENCNASSPTVLVPFTGQAAAEILARADLTVTRSGGLTAGELLALHRRGDSKRFLLHVEPVGDEAKTRALAALPNMKSEEQAMGLAANEAALLGMVPWEAGNARYLERVLGASLVLPESLVSTVLQHKQPSFSINWKLFLQLRGFSPLAIDFAESCSCAHSLNNSRHPADESVISPDATCQKALRAFAWQPLTAKPLLSATIPCNHTLSIVQRLPSSHVTRFLPQLERNLKDLAMKAVVSCNASLLTHAGFLAVQL